MEKKEKEEGAEKVLEERIVENYPNLTKDIHLWIKEAEQIPNRIKSEKSMFRTHHSQTSEN